MIVVSIRLIDDIQFHAFAYELQTGDVSGGKTIEDFIPRVYHRYKITAQAYIEAIGKR